MDFAVCMIKATARQAWYFQNLISSPCLQAGAAFGLWDDAVHFIILMSGSKTAALQPLFVSALNSSSFMESNGCGLTLGNWIAGRTLEPLAYSLSRNTMKRVFFNKTACGITKLQLLDLDKRFNNWPLPVQGAVPEPLKTLKNLININGQEHWLILQCLMTLRGQKSYISHNMH